MVNPDVLEKLQELRADHFYDKRHVAIYTAILELRADGEAIDATSVTSRLNEGKKLNVAGGRIYVTELAMQTVSTATADYHAKIVIDKWVGRKIAHAGRSLVEAGETQDATTATEMARQVLAGIEKRQNKGKSTLPVKDAAVLMEEVYPPINWIIQDLLPDGLTLLAGAPKSGKSWMALDVAMAVARGRNVFGDYETFKHGVLYLAREDNYRRLQSRIKTVDADAQFEPGWLFLTNASSGNPDETPTISGILDTFDRFLAEHPHVKLIILDTLAKIMPMPNSKGSAYREDYSVYGKLQEFALQRNVTVLGIHHTKKGKGADVFDEVSGSNGVFGSTDACWVIKRDRNERTGTLHITGRDVREDSFAAEFDELNCRWSLQGDPRQAERKKVAVQLHEVFDMRPFTVKDAMGVFDASRATAQRKLQELKDCTYLTQSKKAGQQGDVYHLTDHFLRSYMPNPMTPGY